MPVPTGDAVRRQNARRTQRRPPRLRSVPARPRGPERYYQAEGANIRSGPGEPPPGFITFSNSRAEWWVYWALAKVLGWPKDPRRPPFVGWPGLWTYQVPFEGGRTVRGGQIVDFIVHGPITAQGDIALRIQTERYHLFVDAVKHAIDFLLHVRLSRYQRTVNLYEQDFIKDPSGQAVCIEVKRAIFGGSASNPLRAGTARRIRL